MSITKPITIVLGAGASAEYGFPLGLDLIKQIQGLLTYRFQFSQPEIGDRIIFGALQKRFPDRDMIEVNRYLTAAGQLVEVMHHYPSIDEAIHLFAGRDEVIQVGKVAIARSIIDAEQRCSALKADSGNCKVRGVTGWMPKLFSMIVGSLTREELADAFMNLSIINFNYDRSLEHYLFAAIKSLGVTPDKAVSILGRAKFIRPYGSLGLLDWQGPSGFRFGASSGDLFGMADNIRTYTERGHGDGLLSEIKAALGDAAVVIFLGFGFHRQNVELLTVEKKLKRHVFVTAYGIDEANYLPLKSLLSSTLRLVTGSQVEVVQLKCDDLFSKRSQSIAFGLTS